MDSIPSGAEIVLQSWHASTESASMRPGRVFLRTESSWAKPTVEIRVSGPSGSRRSVEHVVVLVGIHSQINIWSLVLEYVFETTPSRVVLSVLWPYKSFGRSDISEFSPILEPPALPRAPFGWKMWERTADMIEVRRMMRWTGTGHVERHREGGGSEYAGRCWRRCSFDVMELWPTYTLLPGER